MNELTQELSRSIAEALASNSIDPQEIRWMSPLKTEAYREYRDREFLEMIGAGNLAPMLSQFWPKRGPCWDALARLDGGGCVLVEAKSHVPEIYGRGCLAQSRSRPLISSSLAQAKSWLGATPDADWTGSLYQSANRLAHLYFLRKIGKIRAFLVNVYFVGDPHSPTTQQQWDNGIKIATDQLGIGSHIPHHGSVFLHAV